jgi:hypothetical protein
MLESFPDQGFCQPLLWGWMGGGGMYQRAVSCGDSDPDHRINSLGSSGGRRSDKAGKSLPKSPNYRVIAVKIA